MYLIKFETRQKKERFVAHPGVRKTLEPVALADAAGQGLLTEHRRKAFGFSSEGDASRFVNELLRKPGWADAARAGHMRPELLEIATPAVPSRLPPRLMNSSSSDGQGSGLLRGVSVQDFESVLHAEGFQCKTQGDRIVSSTGGATFQIVLYGSSDETGKAGSCQFLAAFCLSGNGNGLQDRAAEWNRAKRFPKASVHEGNLVATLDFMCGKGVSRDQLKEYLSLWCATLGQLMNSGLLR